MAFPIIPIIALGAAATAAAITVYKRFSKVKSQETSMEVERPPLKETEVEEQKSITQIANQTSSVKTERKISSTFKIFDVNKDTIERIQKKQIVDIYVRIELLLYDLKNRELLKEDYIDPKSLEKESWPEDFLKKINEFRISRYMVPSWVAERHSGDIKFPMKILEILMPEFEKKLEIPSIEDILADCDYEIKALLRRIDVISEIKPLYDDYSENIGSLNKEISSLVSFISFNKDKEIFEIFKRFDSIIEDINNIFELKDEYDKFYDFIQEIIQEKKRNNFYSKYAYLGHCPYEDCLSRLNRELEYYGEDCETKLSFETEEGAIRWFTEKLGEGYEPYECPYGKWYHFKTIREEET